MIRLITVIGHGLELIPNFIKHYSKFVDEINVVLYQSKVAPNIIAEGEEKLKNYNNVKIVKTIEDRVFDWEQVTKLYNFVKSKKPNDWWVVSDIDEFHLYPNDNLKLCIDSCDENGWKLMRGGFVDRIGEDGEFTELVESKNIFKQFPNMGFFRYPMSKACPNKVCVMKGNIEITPGQHYAKIDGQTTWKWQGWNHPLIAPIDTHSVQVHHFKWDKTCADRIKEVANNNQDYSYSEEYRLMYKELGKKKFKINLSDEEFLFERSDGSSKYSNYKQWNKLIKQITSI